MQCFAVLRNDKPAGDMKQLANKATTMTGSNSLSRQNQRERVNFGYFLLNINLLTLELPHGLEAVEDLLESPSGYSQRLEQRHVDLRMNETELETTRRN